MLYPYNGLLQCVCVCVYKCSQLCTTLYNSMDCSPPGSSVHGILQARILEWVTIYFSREFSPPRDWTHISCVSCISRWVLYQLSHQGSSYYSTAKQNDKRIKIAKNNNSRKRYVTKWYMKSDINTSHVLKNIQSNNLSYLGIHNPLGLFTAHMNFIQSRSSLCSKREAKQMIKGF